MAINVNRLDVGALAGLASRGTPNLNLPLFGVDYSGYGKNILAAALANQQANTQLTGYQNQYDIAQMQEGGANLRNQNTMAAQMAMAQAGDQNQMDIAQLNNATRQQDILQQGQIAQGQLGLGYDQLAQQSQYQQGQLGIQNKQLGINQQLADQEAAMNKIKAMQMMKQMDLARIGAASTIALMGMNQYSKDPAKQAQFKDSWIKQGIDNGTLDKETAARYAEMDNDSFAREMMQNTIYSSIAGSQHGANMSPMLPNLTNVYGNITADKTTEGAAQLGTAEAGRSGIDINSALANFPAELFTYAGNQTAKAGTVLGRSPEAVKRAWNWLSDASGGTIPQAQEATDLGAAQQAFKGNILQSMMSTLNQQKGARFNEQTLESISAEVPDFEHDSPESAFAKLVTLDQRMQRAGAYQAELVKKGIPAGSDKYNDLVVNFMKSQPVPGKIAFKRPDTGDVANIGYNEAHNFAIKNNISDQQAIQYFLANQVVP